MKPKPRSRAQVARSLVFDLAASEAQAFKSPEIIGILARFSRSPASFSSAGWMFPFDDGSWLVITPTGIRAQDPPARIGAG